MKSLFLMVFLSALFACASPTRPAQDVRVNMDKDEVLKAAGNPKYTYRSEDKDHWVYQFDAGDRLFTQTVTFDGGKVVQVGRAQAKDSPNKDLENSSSMEEFERKARAMQKAKASGKFKSLDN